jgi:hypothetical protein
MFAGADDYIDSNEFFPHPIHDSLQNNSPTIAVTFTCRLLTAAAAAFVSLAAR